MEPVHVHEGADRASLTARTSACLQDACRSTGNASWASSSAAAKPRSAGQAADAIFGYTIENDVSDRGGRGDTRYGSDWVVGKNHDTFAPMGPFITPKEFVADPRKMAITVDLNGQKIQEGNTSLMIHDVFEQIVYASNIMTLHVGDVIATGTPAGVGSARMPPVYLKGGDRITYTYEGLGTLSNPVFRRTSPRSACGSRGCSLACPAGRLAF